MTGWCLDKVIFHLEDGTDFESGINGGSLRTRQDIDTATEHLCGLKHYGVSYDYNGYSGCDYMGLGIELTVCSIATGFITHLISYIGDPPDGFGSKAVLYDSGLVSWPCQIVGFETQPDDTDIGTRETITNVTTNCEGSQFAPKTPPPPTQGPSPTPRPVALDSAPQQESLPTSRPTEPSATPDEPLGAKSWGTGVGWCYSRLNKEIWATTPQECWTDCHAAYGEQLVAVDFWDDGYGYGNSKACYCQDECQCMVQTEDNYDTVYVITVDSISELRSASSAAGMVAPPYPGSMPTPRL